MSVQELDLMCEVITDPKDHHQQVPGITKLIKSCLKTLNGRVLFFLKTHCKVKKKARNRIGCRLFFAEMDKFSKEIYHPKENRKNSATITNA